MIAKLIRIPKYNVTRLDNYYFIQPNQMAVIFHNINKFWTHRDIHINAKGLARGLRSLNFIKNDTILVRMSSNHVIEKFITKIAASSLETNVIVSKANNQQQLHKQLYQSQARAFFFDSFNKIGDTTVIDLLYRLIPQIHLRKNNQEIMCKNFQFLRFLVQTDNYVYPATYHFKRLIKYEDSNNFDLYFTSHDQPIKIEQRKNILRPIAITDPCDELAFKAGVLNCIVHGKLLYCIDPNQAKQISQKHGNNIDFICTQQMTQLHKQNKVFVKQGSKFYQKHPQRIQIKL